MISFGDGARWEKKRWKFGADAFNFIFVSLNKSRNVMSGEDIHMETP